MLTARRYRIRRPQGPGHSPSVTAISVAFFCLMLAACSSRPTQPDTRLVLAFTVDQLRGDVLPRYRSRFSADPSSGFGYLQRHGVIFSDANFDHATTFTAVGHATLFTGAQASSHGITGNAWFEGNRQVWSVDDPESPVLNGNPNATETGSPRNLMIETVGDALIDELGGAARVFSVSTKERSAILPGGRHGKAFWYDRQTGDYVTSRYYYEKTPTWLVQWNELGRVEELRNKQWNLLDDRAAYIYADADDAPWEPDTEYLGNTFPHTLDRGKDTDFFSVLRATPMADDLTLDVARRLIEAERIGQRSGIDMLAIGLSATDYVGHVFGPSSLEAEDNVFRLDRALGKFLDFIDERVGLEHTVIVLSADHGVPEIPERYIAMGSDSGRIDIPDLMRRIRTALSEKFDTDRNLLTGFSNPAIFLDHSAIGELQIDPAAVEAAVAEIASDEPGVAVAITRTQIGANQIPDPALAAKIRNGYYASRSGDVILVQKPNWYLHPRPDAYATMHGSPYRYDTHIPLIFVVPGVTAREIGRPVRAVDMAPTLASILGLGSLEHASGQILTEAVPALPGFAATQH